MRAVEVRAIVLEVLRNRDFEEALEDSRLRFKRSQLALACLGVTLLAVAGGGLVYGVPSGAWRQIGDGSDDLTAWVVFAVTLLAGSCSALLWAFRGARAAMRR